MDQFKEYYYEEFYKLYYIYFPVYRNYNYKINDINIKWNLLKIEILMNKKNSIPEDIYNKLSLINLKIQLLEHNSLEINKRISKFQKRFRQNQHKKYKLYGVEYYTTLNNFNKLKII